MTLQRKRNAVLLALVLVATGGTACEWLKNLWRNTCFGAGCRMVDGRLLCGLSACPGRCPCPFGAADGAVVQVPPDYQSPQTVLSILAQTVDNGIAVEGAGECTPSCFDPQSPECDACRSAVGAAMTTPFYSVCQGAIFDIPPERVYGVVRANTDVGTFESQGMWAYRRAGTVRFDTCGAANRADYDLDAAESRRFSTFVVDRGAHQLLRTEWQQLATGGAEDAPMFNLKPEYKQMILQGRGAEISGGASVLQFGAWPFQAGGGDLVLGPGQFDGAIMTPTAGLTSTDSEKFAADGSFTMSSDGRGGMKPCNTDADCSRWSLVCRPSSDGLVCIAP